MDKVYLVGITSCEGCSVEHVCATEEVARDRFEKIRQREIERLAECMTVDEEDGYDYSTNDVFVRNMEYLKAMFYEEPNPNGKISYHDHPFVSIYPVEVK